MPILLRNILCVYRLFLRAEVNRLVEAVGRTPMTDCRTFHGVTESIFSCVKQKSLKEHGTVYDPLNGNKGTATTDVPAIGKIVLSFDLDPSAESLTYCIISKPWIVPVNQIFDGIGDTINSCRQKAPR